MTPELQKLYYESQHKLIFPEDKGYENDVLAATVAANFASIGFPTPSDLTTQLSGASRDDIVEFYESNYAMLSEVIGADRHPTPFYPNFPQSCMNKSEAEYFIDQIIYGLSGLQIEPSLYEQERERFPFIGTPMYHTIEAGSEKEMYDSIRRMIQSPVAYSKLQQDSITAYLKEDTRRVNELPVGKDLKNRENRVALACIVQDVTGDRKAGDKFLDGANDVLRYAAVRSAQRDYERGQGNIIELKPDRFSRKIDAKLSPSDFYHYASLRFEKGMNPSFALSRAERAHVVNLLEKASRGHGDKMAAEMLQQRDLWKKCIKNMHIGEYPRCHETARAFEIVSTARGLDRPVKRIEEAIKEGDVKRAVDESKQLPGDFARRFDKLLRMGIESGDAEYVLSALRETAPKAGIGAALGLAGNIEKRDKDEPYRIFKSPSNGRTTMTKEKNREAIPEYYRHKVASIAQEALVERFSGKEPMGGVYVSSTLENVKVPVDIREQKGGLSSITSGSKAPLPESRFERFFVTWTNIEDSHDENKDYNRFDDENVVDLDLSVAACGSDGRIIDIISWNAGRNDPERGYCFSGDVRDGGPADGEGRAEYIDIDRKKMLEHGVRYIVPQVSSFTGQLFSEQPHTAFGVMSIDEPEFGKEYEPQAVINRFILDSACRQYTPMALDLEKNEILWVDARSQATITTQSLEAMLGDVRYAQDSKILPLYPVVMANAEANGHITSPDEADMLFVQNKREVKELKAQYPDVDFDKKTIIEASDLDYITGFLMTDGEKDLEWIIEEKEMEDGYDIDDDFDER